MQSPITDNSQLIREDTVDALLLLDEGVYQTLTGPGFDEDAFHDAKRKGEHLPQEKCGRVYIQA